MGYNNTGYIVLDSNFVVNPSNIVAIHTISYGAYASFDCGRANNYSPTSNNTTITSSTDLRSSILKIAAGELGNTNGSKYGSGAWCAHFVSWCARQAGVEKNVIANSGYATADDLGVLYFGRKIVNGKRTEIDYSQYVPQKGDLIFFDWENNGICMKTPESFYGDHVGFVESFDLNKKEVKTIEGNSSNAVRRKTYSINDVNIKGYGIPSYPSDSLNGKVSDNISITLLNASVPSKVKQGDAAYFKGTISANSPIKIAGIAIYDSNSNMVSYASKTIYPNTNSVSIDSQIDPSIHISQLPSGTYTYMIFASCMQSIFDILKTTKILKKGTFVVSSANSTVMAGVSLVSLIEKAYVSPSTTTKTDSSSKNSKTYKVGNYTVDTSAGLNVRKGPSTDFDIIGHASLNQEIEVIGRDKGGWYEFMQGDEVAFISDSLVAEEAIDMEALAAAALAASQQSATVPTAKAPVPAVATAPAAQAPAPVQVAAPAGVLFIGDSRCVQMKDAVAGGGCSWICQNGARYEWFADTAIPRADGMVGKGTKVVICMGVNDTGDVSKYAALTNVKAAEWTARGAKVYYVSVNPVSENPYTSTEQVDNFNASIVGQLIGVRWIDTNTYLKGVGYNLVDGLHYDNDTYLKIFSGIISGLR